MRDEKRRIKEKFHVPLHWPLVLFFLLPYFYGAIGTISQRKALNMMQLVDAFYIKGIHMHCQRVNGEVPLVKPAFHPIAVMSPWYHLGVDFISFVSLCGNCYISAVCDYCTKWAEALPTPDKTAFQTTKSVFKVQ